MPRSDADVSRVVWQVLVHTSDPLSTAAETMSEGVEATEFEDGVLVREYRVRQRAEVTSRSGVP